MNDANDPFSFDAEYGDPDFVMAARDPHRPPETGPEWGLTGARQTFRSSQAGPQPVRNLDTCRLKSSGPCRAAGRRTVFKQRHRQPKDNGNVHQGQNRDRDAPRRHDAAAARRAHQISDRRQQDGAALAQAGAVRKQAERK